jgi:hypothetical protein
LDFGILALNVACPVPLALLRVIALDFHVIFLFIYLFRDTARGREKERQQRT